MNHRTTAPDPQKARPKATKQPQKPANSQNINIIATNAEMTLAQFGDSSAAC
jgi:hypothetical protein